MAEAALPDKSVRFLFTEVSHYSTKHNRCFSSWVAHEASIQSRPNSHKGKRGNSVRKKYTTEQQANVSFLRVTQCTSDTLVEERSGFQDWYWSTLAHCRSTSNFIRDRWYGDITESSFEDSMMWNHLNRPLLQQVTSDGNSSSAVPEPSDFSMCWPATSTDQGVTSTDLPAASAMAAVELTTSSLPLKEQTTTHRYPQLVKKPLDRLVVLENASV